VFYLSTLSKFTAQYVDALGATGNFPITRREWLDEETNSAQSEWMEKEQARQFGEWTGQTPEEVNDDDDDAHGGGPKAANVMDWPDCLEDVFALVSSVCCWSCSGDFSHTCRNIRCLCLLVRQSRINYFFLNILAILAETFDVFVFFCGSPVSITFFLIS
jgi:hypothetical protein